MMAWTLLPLFYVCLILEMELTANGLLLNYTFSPESPTTKIYDHFPTIFLKRHSLCLINSASPGRALLSQVGALTCPSRHSFSVRKEQDVSLMTQVQVSLVLGL